MRLSILLLAMTWFPTAVFGDEGTDFFERKIRPVLVEHCYECHSSKAQKAMGGLELDTKARMRDGGDSGAGVVPKSLDESLILDAIRYESFEMPPTGKLSDEIIRDFEKWIRMGAPDPRKADHSVAGNKPASDIDWLTAKNHWAFQPPRSQPMPSLSSNNGVQNRIDQFVRHRQQALGLEHNETADDVVLLRRLTFDLTGLPPTLKQTSSFLKAATQDRESAINQLVDELLASPAYGEHWAAMWLDLMRYAEDQAHIVGNNKSLFYPNAYLYRDWLIQAFNADMRYDTFIQLQLAADQITPDDPDDDVALGFVGLGPKYYNRGSQEVKADEYEDRVDTVTRGLLGLTVACARCHDHKYDPIATEDYYALAGVFASTDMFNRPLNESVKQKNGAAKEPKDALHIIRDTKPVDLHVMIRGDVKIKGDLVPRRFLRVLSGQSEPTPFTRGSGRWDLAESIASPDNPLTARVIVNRVWAQHFGRGLVRTNSNFGVLGDQPSLPRLLDDLAFRFMENGWSLKWLHREIVRSSVYQQSSELSEIGQQLDEDNAYLWRMPRRRLSIEQWRDAILSVSGELVSSVGGPSMEPFAVDSNRRTLYSSRSRFQQDATLVRFDFPDSNSHAANRVETTTPLQKLFVLNAPYLLRRAETLAERIEASSGKDVERIEFAYRLLFSRSPRATEVELGQKFVQTANWSRYAHALLASNEMFFLD